MFDRLDDGALAGFGKRLRERHGSDVARLPDDMMALLLQLDSVDYQQPRSANALPKTSDKGHLPNALLTSVSDISADCDVPSSGQTRRISAG